MRNAGSKVGSVRLREPSKDALKRLEPVGTTRKAIGPLRLESALLRRATVVVHTVRVVDTTVLEAVQQFVLLPEIARSVAGRSAVEAIGVFIVITAVALVARHRAIVIQVHVRAWAADPVADFAVEVVRLAHNCVTLNSLTCLLYTSDAADE